MKTQYSFSEKIQNAYYLLLTHIQFKNARLIRRPIYIRGKNSLTLGDNFTIGRHTRIDLPGNKPTLKIGKNCNFGDYCHIVAYEDVSIGNNCLLASKVFVSDTSHGQYKLKSVSSAPDVPPNNREIVTLPVKISDNVWLGENVCVLAGVSIGYGSIIGANSVVTKDIPDKCIAVGSPAKVIKKWDDKTGMWVSINEGK